MNVEICFLTNACQAAFPNLTKFNQTAHLADESKRERGEEGEKGGRRGSAAFSFLQPRKEADFNELIKDVVLSFFLHYNSAP